MAKRTISASISVNRRPRTDNEQELASLITATTQKFGLKDFSQVVKDLSSAGIVVGENDIAIVADKLKVQPVGGGTTQTVYNDDGTIRTDRILSEQVVSSGLTSSTMAKLRVPTVENLFSLSDTELLDDTLYFSQAYGLYSASGYPGVNGIDLQDGGGQFIVSCMAYCDTTDTSIVVALCGVMGATADKVRYASVPQGEWTECVFYVTLTDQQASGDSAGKLEFATEDSSPVTLALIQVARTNIPAGAFSPGKADIATAKVLKRTTPDDSWLTDDVVTTEEEVDGNTVTVYSVETDGSGKAMMPIQNVVGELMISKVMTLTFYAKASKEGQQMRCMMPYNAKGGADFTPIVSKGTQQTRIMTAGGIVDLTLSTQWHRFFIHWMPEAGHDIRVQVLDIMAAQNKTAGITVSLADVELVRGYICEENFNTEMAYSKIEQTADRISLKVATAQTTADEAASDASSALDAIDATKSALLETGIDIEKKKVTVTADKFFVQNNQGVNTMSVDQDGNLVTSGNASFKGTITATAGEIRDVTAYNLTVTNGSHLGNFIISGGYLMGYASESDTADFMELKSDAIEFIGASFGTQRTQIGTDVYAATGGVDKRHRHIDIVDTVATDALAYDKQGIRIDVGGAYSNYTNFAMLINGGCIGGMALSTQMFAASGAINSATNVALVTGNSAITLTLPDYGTDTKYDGRIIFIKKLYGNAVTVNASGNNYIVRGSSSGIENITSYKELNSGWSFMGVAFIFFARMNGGSDTQKGAWVEFKLSPNWE